MPAIVASADDRPTGLRPLDHYFHDLDAHRRLRPAEEIELAQQLRAAKVELWRALVGVPVDPLLQVAGPHLDPNIATSTELRALARALSRRDPEHLSVARDEAAVLLARADRDGAAASAVFDTVLPAIEDELTRRRARMARAAALALRDRFVASNLGLVVVLARRYDRRHLSLDDLIQEGNTGLLKAVDRFDPDRGFRFSTYAVWWIRHAIGRALSDKGREIRLPVHVAERQQTVLRARAALEARVGRTPSVGELATATGFSEEKVSDLLSVEYTRASGGRQALGTFDVDQLSCDPGFDVCQFDADRFDLALRRALRALPPIQQDVLRRRFGLNGDEPMTLREVGEIHRLSRERIRQLQERALCALRREFRRRGLA